MTAQVFNLNIKQIDPLPTPAMIKEELPITDRAADLVAKSREEIQDIIQGRDQRMLAIIGPCSIHDRKAAREYALKLQKLREEVQDEIVIVMRVYFEKPRTTVGWKGLINDPHLDGTYEVVEGLKLARAILLEFTDEIGLACSTEMLDPVAPQYLADLITWSAIGARTTESQIHREMASGLSMPVGFKNSTTGDLQVAINGIKSSLSPHSFIGINQEEGKACVFHTRGNKDAHLVMRGGSRGPNYTEEHIKAAEQQLENARIETGIMVDCSHANSNKDHTKQAVVLEDIIKQKKEGNKSIVGFMLESNLEGGNQPIPEDRSLLKYGVSITDKCVNWETTEEIVKKAAEELKKLKVAA